MDALLLDPPAAGGVSEVFAAALLAWWEDGPRAERDRLPWRRLRDPWAVLLSEVMLAQTQAGRVAERFPSLLARFPDAGAMADAGAGEVLRAWSGLGYNRRAASLHRLATVVLARHGGELPRSLEELLGLPGVGPYTARAVLAFAYGDPVGVVDTNIGRVLARAVAGRPLATGEAQHLADSLVPAGLGREWNLALMDLGSLVCRARAPRCSTCPIGAARACRWRARSEEGAEGADPAVGSARTSTRQGRFAGSDRQLRGRLLGAACAGSLRRSEIAQVAGCPDDPERASRIVERLVTEGLLVERRPGRFTLP